MSKKLLTLSACFLLLACSASGKPQIVQTSTDMPEVRLTPGMATQIEMPESGHVQSVVTGNPALVTVERSYNVVNLIPKSGSGETNLIIRFFNDDSETKVYQYKVIIEGR
jgi:hypothetical protein